MSEVAVKGNTQERKAFTEVYRHYEMSTEDLDSRLSDFDTKDVLFRSHIEESTWPYRAMVFDPRTFTAIYEKTARLLANKPRGRLVPRESGDALGAMINNELLSFQWDDNERVDGTSMIAKWALMDMNARKYGASFGLVKWHYQTEYEMNKGKKESYTYYNGPNFKPWNNRDVLHNPSYPQIKHWIQLRDYLTLDELTQTNDTAKTKPIYKNLDVLRDALKQTRGQSGDTRSSNYQSKNLTISNLQDYLGQDEFFKVVEVVTEYRCDRWITFAPKHGVILRDVPNPYEHGQIPVVLLKYYPIDEDIYGLSEIEPIEKIQKAINALLCQYLDAVNISTYPIVKVRSTGGAVQMHTLEFGPGQKWLMSDPQSDVLPYTQSNPAGVTEFGTTYRYLVSAMQEALGETSAGFSNIVPGESKKTATEIRDTSAQRNVRDNFNSIFLSEAMKKQMMFWFKMNQQFMFSDKSEQQKVLRITSKDAIKFFQGMGLDGYGLSNDTIGMLTQPSMVGVDFRPEDFGEPMYPTQVGENTIPKMVMDDTGQEGSLIIEPDDLSGAYDYIPDIDTMRIPDEAQLINSSRQIVELALNPATMQQLQMEGYQLKLKEVLEDYFEKLGVKDVEKYFEKVQQMPGMQGGLQNGQAQQPGAGGVQAGPANMPYGGNGGMGQGALPMAGGQNEPVVPRPV